MKDSIDNSFDGDSDDCSEVAFSQCDIMQKLRATYEKRPKNPQQPPCEILNAPGMCNGLVNLYFRKIMKNMKTANTPFTYEIALKTAEEFKKICANILTSDDQENLERRLDQLCFFQSPRALQPHGSFCGPNQSVTIDNPQKIHHAYNLNKYLDKKNKTPVPSGEQSLPYIRFYDKLKQIQCFSGCITHDELYRVLSYYLPRHPNQIIRVATPIHVIGLAFHPSEDEKKYRVSIMDPNYNLREPVQFIEEDTPEDCFYTLVKELDSIFYGNIFYQHRLTLSAKFFHFADAVIPHVEESGAEYLTKLLAEESTDDPEFTAAAQDANGYDALFIAAQTGDLDTVKALLTQYPTQIKPGTLQGEKYHSTPLAASKQQGHFQIACELELHRYNNS